MKVLTMTNQVGFIAIIAIGLVLLIPGMNVEANSSHHQSHLHGSKGKT